MDLSKLGRGERLVLIGSAALLILSFVPLWAKVEAAGVSSRFGAWDFGLAVKIPLILAIILVVVVGMRAAGSNVSLPMAAGQIYLIGGAIMVVLLLIQVIAGVPGSDLGSALGVEVSRGPLLLLSPLVAAVVAYGGWLARTEEGAAPAASPPVPPA